MSRNKSTGINPKNGNLVDIFYGWDEVPGFKPGYFFQVYSRDPEEIKNSPGEGIIVNEGFINGITREELISLSKVWNCRVIV